MPGSEIVMVPVPREHLEAVYGFLAARTNPDPTAVHQPTPQNAVEVEGQGRWDEGMIERLKASLHLSAARTLLDAAAQAAPNELAMQDVARDHGIPANQLRAQMGALTKLSVKLFGARVWPVSVRHGDEPATATEPAKTGLAYYRMHPKVAGWWQDAT